MSNFNNSGARPAGADPPAAFSNAFERRSPRGLSAEEAVNQLLQRTAKAGVHLGLTQITQLLARLGDPHQAVPIVHVAGTNGKGSVCAYLSSALTQAGYCVGRYTSPHLVSWTERICINEEPIASEVLLELLHKVTETAATHDLAPTQFELITAVAWLHFAQQRVDIAVMEVGLGGRLDATNICDRPLATAITSIGRDHWQRLGPTLAHIAGEKAGILKPGVPAVVGPVPEEAAAVITQRSQTVGCPLIWVSSAVACPGPLSPKTPQKDPQRNWAEFLPPSSAFSSLTYPLGLLGTHQYANSAVAIALLQLLQAQGWAIPTKAIQAGLGQAQWPARLQWTRWRGMPLLIDGAHNADAACALRHYIDQAHSAATPTAWVMGMLSTKDHREILTILLRPGDRVCFVPVPGHQTAAPQDLLALAHQVCPQLCATTATDGFQGLDWASSDPSSQASPLVLCGSLYLIGHMVSQRGQQLV
ncbi:MAG: bifunctional folylpolyglutamate synthase/dihydrofolate synthase [Elainellaceae cyanobacterium]